MRVFMTGATGYVGSAVLQAFLRAGAQVTALVRTASQARHLEGLAAATVVGSLAEPQRFETAARSADVLVHAALDSSPARVELDARAIDALAAAAHAAPPKAFIYTSGSWVIGPAPTPVDESATLDPTPLASYRPAHEARVAEAARDGVRIAIVRPGIVYGASRGIIGDMLRDAQNGLVRVVGAGDNIWPLVYDRDAADLYVRIASTPGASGIYHATDDSDEQVNDIAAAMARLAGRPVDIRHMPLPEARAKLGAYADALALSQRLRSVRSRGIGWSPTLRGVVRNLPRLFEEWRNDRNAESRA